MIFVQQIFCLLSPMRERFIAWGAKQQLNFLSRTKYEGDSERGRIRCCLKKKTPPGNKKIGKQNFSWKAVAATRESQDPSLQVTHFLLPYTLTDTKTQLRTKRDMRTVCLTYAPSEEMLSNWCQQLFRPFLDCCCWWKWCVGCKLPGWQAKSSGCKSSQSPTPPYANPVIKSLSIC